MPIASLPGGYADLKRETLDLVRDVDGMLGPEEMEFLVLLGACPTAAGEVLEIGSFQGKSTVLLAKAAALAGEGRIVAVDPLVKTAATDPGRHEGSSWARKFDANIERCGVGGSVEFHRMLSTDLAETWDRPLRLLWVDGDHTYEGAKADFDGFARHLADGAIIALHDVLNLYPGPIRVFTEDVLPSDRFGAAGVCGSIGWAQHLADPAAAGKHARAKTRLRRKLRRLVPYAARGRAEGLGKHVYRFARSLVPYGPVDPKRWLGTVEFPGE